MFVALLTEPMLALLLACVSAPTSPAAFIKAMQLGINLGNVLDAPFEGAWAEPAKEYYFDDYLNQGFKSVRVPVRWDKHTSTAPPWKVDSKFMDRVEQIVGWSLKRGLRTVLNTHHDDWLDDAASDEDFQVQLSRLVAIWTQIAQRFASKSEELLAFEVYNEPHANMTLAWLNQMNAAVLPAIRATNPTRNVFFGGLKFMNPHWIVDQPDAMHFPANDSHVLLEVHSYDPYDFCGMTTGHITHSWARSDIDGWVDALAAWAARRQMPVLLGEFGCNKTQTNSSGRVGWYSHLRRAVESKGFAATVWDDSGSFAIYERSSRTWDADVLHALGLGATARASDHTAPAGRNEAVDAPRPAVASNVARPTVKVPGLGVVEGVTSAEYPSVDRFFAIPYAKSPVGELRWAPPEPHGPFRKSHLNGTAPGKVCIQPAKMSQRFDPSAPPVPYIQLPMGEDCLTLNIATPAARRGDGDGNATLLPVMVWFHGGGYSIGAGAHYRNDALVHASAGKVVVVTLNYRLGVFGFLGSSELAARTAARSGDRSTGNYGIDDQRLALRWVKAHIAAFGGDPDAVTIFGESAGGNSVVTHLVEPRSFGEDRLYSRAIIQSGTYPAAHTFEYAEATYGQVLKGTNCTDVQCLLGVDALDVAAAYPPGMVGPLVDGIALVDDPYSLLDAGSTTTACPSSSATTGTSSRCGRARSSSAPPVPRPTLIGSSAACTTRRPWRRSSASMLTAPSPTHPIAVTRATGGGRRRWSSRTSSSATAPRGEWRATSCAAARPRRTRTSSSIRRSAMRRMGPTVGGSQTRASRYPATRSPRTRPRWCIPLATR